MARKQDKKKKTELSVIHLAEYNLPTITETSGKDWISFGEDNLYPNYIIELYNGSSINNAVIKGVAEMIYGEGLDATDKDEDDYKKESWIRLNSLLHKSQKDVLKCMCFDFKLFGMCYVNVIWNKPRTKIVSLSHIPAQNIRTGKADGYGKIGDYYYSANWGDIRKLENKPRLYKAFNTEDRTEASQILCIKDYSPSNFYYSVPDYVGSTSYINLEMEISQFHLANIKSGMFPSMVVNFANGIPTREERQKIEQQINNKFSGSYNAGKILITFNDGKDSAPEIVPINANDNSEAYQFLAQETTRKILTGHRITSPLLFGVKGDGSGFGNNADELRDSFSLFMNTVVKPMQNTILKGLEDVFKTNGIELSLFFKTLKPADFIDIDTIDVVSDDEAEEEGVEVENEKEELSIYVNDDNEKVCLDYFDEIGMQLDDIEWFEAHTEVVNETEDTSKYHEFAYAPAGKPNVITNASDIGMFRLLYRYSTNISANSRIFCQKMVAKSQAGTLYTLDDLKNASTKAVNKGFGPKGTNTYNIFFYKGGANCKHHWERVWYFRRQVPKGATFVDSDGKEYKEGEFLPNGTLNNFRKVSQNFAYKWRAKPKQDDRKARKAPYDMPNHGYLKPR